jgi:hypothetical protein
MPSNKQREIDVTHHRNTDPTGSIRRGPKEPPKTPHNRATKPPARACLCFYYSILKTAPSEADDRSIVPNRAAFIPLARKTQKFVFPLKKVKTSPSAVPYRH